jgi:hypothetical protein
MDSKENEVDSLWKYINKLEFCMIQIYKDKIRFKKSIKNKLKK